MTTSAKYALPAYRASLIALISGLAVAASLAEPQETHMTLIEKIKRERSLAGLQELRDGAALTVRLGLRDLTVEELRAFRDRRQELQGGRHGKT